MTSVVKLPNKEKLDKLAAKLTLRLGVKVTQQDLLEKCIELSDVHIEELETYFSDKLNLTSDRVREIEETADEFDFDMSKSIDDVLYGDD
jgi:2-polyprenyl-3-methyl-5-hydroxy-6-metoxy-1,4-benzoquinol methylase